MKSTPEGGRKVPETKWLQTYTARKELLSDTARFKDCFHPQGCKWSADSVAWLPKH